VLGQHTNNSNYIGNASEDSVVYDISHDGLDVTATILQNLNKQRLKTAADYLLQNKVFFL
jgi:hypothetical protein